MLCGLATALYIGAQLGRGPRDGLMTGLARRTGLSLRLVRTGLEVTVVVVGLLLGGVARRRHRALRARHRPAHPAACCPPGSSTAPSSVPIAVELTASTRLRVAMRADASGATITSTAVKRSSVSHSSRRVSTRP